jgi:hypothetical protein
VLLALDLLGGVLKWLALMLAAPAAVALADGKSVLPFLITGFAVGLVGLGLDRLTPRSQWAGAWPARGVPGRGAGVNGGTRVRRASIPA